jgi:hypothetical protein
MIPIEPGEYDTSNKARQKASHALSLRMWGLCFRGQLVWEPNPHLTVHKILEYSPVGVVPIHRSIFDARVPIIFGFLIDHESISALS